MLSYSCGEAPCSLLSLPSHFLQIFPCSCRRWGMDSIFPSFWFHQGRGFSLAYNNHRCTVFSPCPQITLQSALCTLLHCTGLGPRETTSLCTSLIIPPGALSMSKSLPQPSLLVALTAVCMCGSCPACLSSPFKEFSLGTTAVPIHCPAFCTL